jgi:hypothetical protein
MIKRALKVAGVFGLLAVCLALDNPPPDPTEGACRKHCQSIVPAGVEEVEKCVAECLKNGGPPSCSFTGF